MLHCGHLTVSGKKTAENVIVCQGLGYGAYSDSCFKAPDTTCIITYLLTYLCFYLAYSKLLKLTAASNARDVSQRAIDNRCSGLAFVIDYNTKMLKMLHIFAYNGLPWGEATDP